ncbi:MAG: histidine kinase [Hespellia sp.]|nr:histidine kinase [Hespellia sp.]
MKKIKQFYMNLKLQTKLMITHLVIVTLPMIVIGIFFYTSLYDMILSNTIRNEQTASAQTAPLIESTVNNIVNIHDKIQAMEFYQSLCSSSRAISIDALGRCSQAISFRQKVDELINETSITSVKLYLDLPADDELFVVSAFPDIVKPMDSARGTYWHGIFGGDSALSELDCPPFYLSSYERENLGTMAYITKSYVHFDDGIRPCYLAIYYSQDELNQLLLNALASDDSVAYLVNSRDNIAATSDDAMSGAYHFSYSEVQKYFMSSNNFIEKKVMGKEVYAGFYSIQNTDWYMVIALPAKPVIAKCNNLIMMFTLIYVICIIIAFAIATLLSRSITNRLSSVIRQMEHTRVAPPIALPDADTTDELGDLVDSYNYMTRVINRLMEEQAEAADELRIAEFNSLQAQINPHFLYNTMDMINWLSQQNRSLEVTTAVQKLSRFYKLTLSRKESLNTIEDEIEHVSIYVQLQNMRFHNDIDFIIDIPDGILDYSIPKLTFQPVVENSILHGILEKESKQGTIVLTGWLEGEDIVILISDNGVGIPSDQLSMILNGNECSSKKGGTNIAIYNTHKRLQILYGKKYGLKYNSILGCETNVEIRLPAIRPDHET